MKKYDFIIVGAGVLGTTTAYWVSQLYEGNFAVVEMESTSAEHTSGRNTGVIHRPFYLNPERRKVFAHSSQVSYALWKKYAALRFLPWKEVRTLEVAIHPHEIKTLEKYMDWAIKNGMNSSEIEYLSPQAVRKLEPEVVCIGAVYAKTDTAVDYRLFTQSLQKDAEQQGAQFLFQSKVKNIQIEKDGLILYFEGQVEPIFTRFLLNCAGGNSIDLMHMLNVGLEYTDLHFRGEYWQISPKRTALVNTNIYSVPRHAELPFLDPHWIVRADGRCEIGPNAVLVSGCETYSGFFSNWRELVQKVFEQPRQNKVNLFTNREFLSLASDEWKSSLSKRHMLSRVQQFIPSLQLDDLFQKGTAGIRSSVIDRNGNFMKEAIEFSGAHSFHITNYNSPGATGAPGYTAFLVNRLEKQNYLAFLKKRSFISGSFWNYKEVLEKISEGLNDVV